VILDFDVFDVILFGGNQFLSFIYATHLFLIQLVFRPQKNIDFKINCLQKTACPSSDTIAKKKR